MGGVHERLCLAQSSTVSDIRTEYKPQRFSGSDLC